MENAVRIAVVDDMPRDREILRSLLLDYAGSHGFSWEISLFSSGAALLAAMEQDRYAVVFLDILMDGLDGIETARRLRAIDSDVLLVFVTTEAEYAVEGYEVEAAGFLVKGDVPQKKRFDRLMARLERRLRPDELLDLSAGNAAIKVPAGEVIYAEVIDHDMKLQLRDGPRVLRMTMEELKPLLPQDGRFFECHRGIVINLDTVTSLGGQVVTMENGDTLPVSRRRRTELERAYAVRSIARVRREL